MHTPDNKTISHETEVVKSISIQGYADLQIMSGMLNCAVIDYQIGNHALIVKSDHPINITPLSGKKLTLHGIVCCGVVKSIEVSHARVIIISNKAPTIKNLRFKPGLITVRHESIIADLLDSESDITQSHYSAALLAKILVFEQELDERQNGILSEIKRNATNPNYNLNDFCEKIHMSRRTAQYLLREYETSFLHELKKNRVIRLKELVSRPENHHKPKSYLAYQAGFKNLQSAQRDFLSITKTPLNNYINLVKQAYLDVVVQQGHLPLLMALTSFCVTH